jgi:signal transduction histidine kinase
MFLSDLPIKRKLTVILMLVSGVVVLLTCASFFAYEFLTFRQTTIGQLSTLGEVVAANSTAALAFKNRDDATEILNSLKAEKHIVSAALYDKDGNLFSTYPTGRPSEAFPAILEKDGFRFGKAHLYGFQPVVQGVNKRLGTLYLNADMEAVYERFRLYGAIAGLVIAVSFLVAYLLSRALQSQISHPILNLAETATAVAERRDYSVRAAKGGKDEVGLLTDAFNQMLTEIQKLNQDLEGRVSERTAQLEEANKELEAFSYSVSHDLRAPLRHVQGYVELLAKHAGDTLNEKCRRYLRIASESVTQMGDLIDDLLDFSRMGRMAMRETQVDLEKLVQETVAGLQPDISDRKVLWKHGPLPWAQGDPALLKQVFVNLLSNAIKYTRGRDPAQIETGVASDNGELVMFVRDNGAGFDMKYVGKLFGVFQRLHRSDEFEGTGVGLANARRIISRHGGRIWAEGKLGEGATFYFTLTKSQKG